MTRTDWILSAAGHVYLCSSIGDPCSFEDVAGEKGSEYLDDLDCWRAPEDVERGIMQGIGDQVKLWNAKADNVDLSMAVLVVLANGAGIASFPGCDNFKVDGDGELTATMAGGVAGVVARGMWVYAYLRHEPDKETAVTSRADPE